MCVDIFFLNKNRTTYSQGKKVFAALRSDRTNFSFLWGALSQWVCARMLWPEKKNVSATRLTNWLHSVVCIWEKTARNNSHKQWEKSPTIILNNYHYAMRSRRSTVLQRKPFAPSDVPANEKYSDSSSRQSWGTWFQTATFHLRSDLLDAGQIMTNQPAKMLLLSELLLIDF